MKAGNMIPLLTNPGKTGLLIHDHGDGRVEATALFNSNGKGAGVSLLRDAVDNHGVNYVECYGPKLNKMYESVGFNVTSSSQFDPSQASPKWNYELDDNPPYYTMRTGK
jgi:hypothetical protein